MKKKCIGIVLLLLISLVGCGKSYTDEEIEAIEEDMGTFNTFVKEFRFTTLYEYDESGPISVVLCEIEENDGIVDKSIIDNASKKIENIKDDLNSYDISEYKGVANYMTTKEEFNYSKELEEQFVQKLDLMYDTVNSALEKYSQILSLGNDGRYNTAEIEEVNKIIEEVHEVISNNLE